MNLKAQIASRITQARKAKGITIKELSARIKTLSAARISNWEQGTRSPGAEEAILLSKELGVAVGWLFGATDNPEGEWIDSPANKIRPIPLFNIQEAPHEKELIASSERSLHLIGIDDSNSGFKSKTLFAVRLEDISMEPDFKLGEIVVIDGECAPKPGNYVLAHLCSKNVMVLRKYSEGDECIFQLLPSNGLWTVFQCKSELEANILGVVTEGRCKI